MMVLNWKVHTFMEFLQHRRDDHAQLLEELFACWRHGGLIGHRYRGGGVQLSDSELPGESLAALWFGV